MRCDSLLRFWPLAFDLLYFASWVAFCVEPRSNRPCPSDSLLGEGASKNCDSLALGGSHWMVRVNALEEKPQTIFFSSTAQILKWIHASLVYGSASHLGGQRAESRDRRKDWKKGRDREKNENLKWRTKKKLERIEERQNLKKERSMRHTHTHTHTHREGASEKLRLFSFLSMKFSVLNVWSL